jgi:hypothetical protein
MRDLIRSHGDNDDRQSSEEDAQQRSDNVAIASQSYSASPSKMGSPAIPLSRHGPARVSPEQGTARDQPYTLASSLFGVAHHAIDGRKRCLVEQSGDL